MQGQLEVGQHVHWDTSGENVVCGPLDGLGIVVAVRKSAFYPVSASREYDIKLAQGGVLTGVHESAIAVPDKKDALQQTVWVSSDTHYEEILLLDHEEQVEILRHKIKELERGNTAVVGTNFPDAALSDQIRESREGFFQRGPTVPDVGVVDIDVVRSKITETLLHTRHDVFARESHVVGAGRGGESYLAGNDKVVTVSTFEPSADPLL